MAKKQVKVSSDIPGLHSRRLRLRMPRRANVELTGRGCRKVTWTTAQLFGNDEIARRTRCCVETIMRKKGNACFVMAFGELRESCARGGKSLAEGKAKLSGPENP